MNESTANYLLPVGDLAPAWRITSQGAHKFLKENQFQTVTMGKRSYLSPSVAREAMKARGIEFKRQILCVQMLKGGVGKTTTALNIAIRASMYGARVLAIDLDQQANLSFALGLDDENQFVWADILEGRCSAASAVHAVSDFFDVIPSNLNNSILDKILTTGKRNIAQSIAQPLAEIINSYDLVVIDTAPNLSAINTAAACASHKVVLPVNPDKFSLDGLRKTLADLDEIQSEFEKRFTVKVLFTKFDGRETSSHALLARCFADFGDKMVKAFVRTSSDFKNVIKSQKTIFSHKGSAKDDYDLITREFLNLGI